jgi:hypothetical protein
MLAGGIPAVPVLADAVLAGDPAAVVELAVELHPARAAAVTRAKNVVRPFRRAMIAVLLAGEGAVSRFAGPWLPSGSIVLNGFFKS